jgi:hypothetical protein
MINWSIDARRAIVACSTDSTARWPAGPRAARIFAASGCLSSAAGCRTAMICAPGERYPRLSGRPAVGESQSGLLSAATFGATAFFAGFFAGVGDFFSATTVGSGGCGWNWTGGLSADCGGSVGPARRAHAAATSTIEIHANIPPRINNCLRGCDVLAVAARVLLNLSAGRCDILV